MYVTEVVADNVQFLEPKNAAHSSQPSNPYPQAPADPYGQPAPMQSAQDPFGADFDTSDTLDIAVMIYHSNRKEARNMAFKNSAWVVRRSVISQKTRSNISTIKMLNY